jgi:hypothetical protein
MKKIKKFFIERVGNPFDVFDIYDLMKIIIFAIAISIILLVWQL